ncbi:hypothetical protein A1F97_05739 [Pyrenophora tritici-repentis]|nr:hypothetical protein TUN205_06555 [Pyrenophora tritici-repentis]PZD39650.1 hypothetical protein A1F97_05739 [Pyrenophora tritici-repentis]
MAPAAQLSKADLKLFLQQLQTSSTDVAQWNSMMRISLVRGGLIDLTIYGRRIASTPRFALMAVFPTLLAFLTEHLRAPAVNFKFDVPKAHKRGEAFQSQLTSAKEKMSDVQIKIHEAALIEIAQWLTALCTPHSNTLTGASLAIETCIRFICANILGSPEYVQHLTNKFVEQSARSALTATGMTELVKSCRGEEDALLVGLASELIQKKLDNQINPNDLRGFMAADGNQLLKLKVESLEKDMELGHFETIQKSGKTDNTILGFEDDSKAANNRVRSKKSKSRVYEVTGGIEVDGDDQVVEIDVDGWEMFPSGNESSSSAKKQKINHKRAASDYNVAE